MVNASKITVTYENGTAKYLKKGIAAEFGNDKMSVEILDVSKFDLVRIAYGMIVTVDKMGLMPMLEQYLSGDTLPDEEGDEFEED